jgi:large subunit ribosomal protein L19
MKLMLIPFFKKGTLLSIDLRYYQGPLHNIQGICIKKKNQGLNSYFSIKSLINNEMIIQTFPLYSPFIKKIEILLKKK